MNFIQKLKYLWELPTKQVETEILLPEVQEIMEDSNPEPFVAFPCEECKEPIEVMSRIFPGQAVVVECDNCGANWTVHSPQLKVYRTKDIPENIQDLWRQVSE